MTTIPKTIAGWFNNTRVRRSTRVEGMRVDEKGLVLGERCAMSTSLPSLLHEMSHFIEIDEARCFVYGWGLKLSTTEIAGQLVEDPQTFQACAREIRVLSIQKVIHTHLNLPFEDSYWAKLIWDFVPGNWAIERHYHKTFPKKSFSEASVVQMAQDIAQQAAGTTIASVWERWKTRCERHDRTFPV